MNLEEKIAEISKEISDLKAEEERRDVRIKLLTKSLKEYQKLLEKANAIVTE